MAAANAEPSEKLQILLMPFFATSHIGPFTDLAVCLATARPGAVEPTIAVTPANVPVVESALKRHGGTAAVKIATYPFPVVDGLPPGIENLSAAGDQAWRIDAVAIDEALTRPLQEALVRELSPDAFVSDVHFFWSGAVAAGLDPPCPCVTFSVIGPFATLVMGCIAAAGAAVVTGGGGGSESRDELAVSALPGPEIRIPVSEVPEFLRCPDHTLNTTWAAMGRCFGVACNVFTDMERLYCEAYARRVKRAYFVGPVSLRSQPPAAAGQSPCLRWLDSKPNCSVVFVCFGTYAAISGDQLRELALGLEASAQQFLWVVRDDAWAPPAGWEDRVGDRGMLVRGWAPQTAVLAHPAVGAFLTHCGSSSLLEAAAAGVPLLTWPLVFDQFIEERLVTDVLRIGERVWAGARSVRPDERVVVPAEAVARSVATFLEPGGAGEAARGRARELAEKARAAVAEGGTSSRDLQRLLDDLIEAKAARNN